MEPKEKKSKWKSLLGKIAIFLVLLALSIATSSVNFLQEGEKFFVNMFTGIAGIANEEETEYLDKTAVVKGKHVQIRKNEIYAARQIFEILDMDNSQENAVEVIKETKTLAYYAEKAGFIVRGSVLNDYIEKLKKKLKDSNEFKYNAMIKEHKSEKAYWDSIEEIIKEKLLTEQLLAEKEEDILRKNENTDVEKALDEYTQERIAEETFKNIMD